MAHFVGLDVSVKETSVCVVDDAGKVILEQKVPTEPDTIIALLTSLGAIYGRIGIEARHMHMRDRTGEVDHPELPFAARETSGRPVTLSRPHLSRVLVDRQSVYPSAAPIIPAVAA